MTNLTKVEMARVVVQALYAMRELPAADHPRVVKMARQPKARLAHNHTMALKVINDCLAKGNWPPRNDVPERMGQWK